MRLAHAVELDTSHAMQFRELHPEKHANVQSIKRTRRKARASFLGLPRELRDIIYEFSLVSTEVVDVLQLATPLRNSKRLGISTALLRVSRQVNGEALHIMYGLNTFEVTISLDPRIPHSYNHDLRPCDQRESDMFGNPMINNIKRLIIRLQFTSLLLWPKHDPSFPAEVLRAFILGGNLDVVLLQPASYWSYMRSLRCSNASQATANAALAAARGSLFSTYLLACIGISNKGTLVVCTPQTHASSGLLDFPWGRLDSHSTATGCKVLCHLPSRFRSSGQMELAMMESIGE